MVFKAAGFETSSDKIIVMLNDEKYYLQVEKELKDYMRDEALWSKSIILAKDDETEAKVQYIKARVAQLQRKEATKKFDLILKKVVNVSCVVLAFFIVALMISFFTGAF